MYRVYSSYELGLFKLCTVQDMIKLLKILMLFMTLKIEKFLLSLITTNWRQTFPELAIET